MTTPASVPRLPIPDGRQLSIRLSQGSQLAVVVLGASATAPVSNAFASAWLSAWALQFAPLIESGTSIVGATLRDVSQAEGVVAEVGAPASNSVGSRGAGRALAASSILVKWSTAHGGRSGKGRSFVPGLQAADMNPDGRTYNATFAALVGTKAKDYVNSGPAIADGFLACVLSFRKGEAYPITGAACASVIGTQRRRMR